MRQSRIFAKTLRESPLDEAAINGKLLARAGFTEKTMAGVYSFLPLGLRVLKKIENILREEMSRVSGTELLMSALTPRENWERTGRWETVDDLFRFKSFYTGLDFALAGTHEEVIVPLVKRASLSYRDLPFALFQIQNKFRDEKRAKSGLLRGREFFMKDLYSFHADAYDLEKYYGDVKSAYRKIFERSGIGEKTYLTTASGGTFSKYSHEFQTLTPAGEDIIHICDDCLIAINDEIASENSGCPDCGNKSLKKEKSVEVGNIFKLNAKYSEPFDLNFTDKDGTLKPVQMGCYGIGLNRLMGTVVEVCHDEKGIVWPYEIAPFRVHLLPLGVSDKVSHATEDFYEKLHMAGVEVLFDDRAEASAGEKFADADLIGIPLRAIVSEKTIEKNIIEIKKRNSAEIGFVSLDKAIETIIGIK